MAEMMKDIPPNEAPINELYAFLSIDEKGNEGICSSYLPGMGTTPFVTSKLRVAEELKDIATEVAEGSGFKIQLVKFVRAENLWEVASEATRKEEKIVVDK